MPEEKEHGNVHMFSCIFSLFSSSGGDCYCISHTNLNIYGKHPRILVGLFPKRNYFFPLLSSVSKTNNQG
ncbi:hypothetical protein, partial [Salmonella sp. s54412]|uniref:hypothetical protein n=1 Tax=Salmonella sp. s54412 TaxID=3160128 RepID=UPI003754A508